MLRAFSVTFNIVAMLSLLLAGIVVYGQHQEWEIPFAWSVVLGCVWLAVLVRVAVMVAGVVGEARSSARKDDRLQEEEPYATRS